MTDLPETEESIEQLAGKAKAGCLRSFEKMVELNQDRLFSYLVQMVGNSHDAQDLAQEAFIRAYRKIHLFDGQARFSTWLFAIAKNTALTHLRKRRFDQSIDEVTEQLHAPATKDMSEAESIWKIARKLKPNYYETLWLFYAEGFNLKEIAEIMKTNSVTVRVNLYRARLALEKKLRFAVER